MFAYPLSTHGAKVGVLTLYQDSAGELSADQHNDSIVMATLLTETVLSLQDTAPRGELARGLEDVVAYSPKFIRPPAWFRCSYRYP